MGVHRQIIRLAKHAYHAWEDIWDGDVLARNAVLRDRYANKRCYVLGTGASLKQVHLPLFAGAFTFACNFLYRHEHFSAMRPTFYAAVPPMRIMRNGPPELRPSRFIRELDTNAHSPMVMFFHPSWRSFIERHRLLGRHEIHYVKPSESLCDAAVLSNDLTKRIPFLDGVLFFMVACACFMGFREIVLVGCGYTYSPTLSGHFYEDWELTQEREVDPRHRLLRDFAQQCGVTVYNAVPNGFASPVYRPLSMDDLHQQLLVGRDETNASH